MKRRFLLFKNVFSLIGVAFKKACSTVYVLLISLTVSITRLSTPHSSLIYFVHTFDIWLYSKKKEREAGF